MVSTHRSPPVNRGIVLAVSAYLLWGLLPIYWKALQSVPAIAILSHRTAWSFIFLVLLLLIRRNYAWLKILRRKPAVAAIYLGTAVMLSMNWLTYIWAVNSGYILETSLGYFINPLVSVALGVIILKERLRHWQWIAVITAGIGVSYLTIGYGSFPWIALTLASTFGLYGLIRKIAPLESMEGLSLETAFLFIPTLACIIYFEINGHSILLAGPPQRSLLLILSGVATAIPLLLFNAGARLITLSSLGFLLYISPTIQFLIGFLVYHEALPGRRLIGFVIIWMALLIYSIDLVLNRRGRTGALRKKALQVD